MLENIPHDKILYYVKNPDILYQDADMIIENAKKWFNENYLQEKDIERIKQGEFVFYQVNPPPLPLSEAARRYRTRPRLRRFPFRKARLRCRRLCRRLRRREF